MKLVPRIARELPEFDVRRVRQLNKYALALTHAQALYLVAPERSPSIHTLMSTAIEHRSRLLQDARPLIQHGLLDAKDLGSLRGVNGYKNVVHDLRFLATFFRERLASVHGRTVLEVEDLQRADELADQILSTLEERKHPAAEVVAAADMRARAFTLLVRSYDQARRAVTYLRWNEQDADRIAPSLYAARSRRGPVSKTTRTASPEHAASPELAIPSPTVPVA